MHSYKNSRLVIKGITYVIASHSDLLLVPITMIRIRLLIIA